jgi:alpha-beta hydrolase superfamily lysophospholipase
LADQKAVNLFTRQWPAPLQPAKGVVLIVHGLGEHSGRYGHVAAYLNQQGWDAFGFDQYGHGRSPGARGAMLTDHQYLDNLALMVSNLRKLEYTKKLVMLGHSMGGGMAARFASLQLCPLDGLILSSPALDIGLGPGQRLLLNILMSLAPGLCIPNGLKVNYISRDQNVIAGYKNDSLVHNKVAVRLIHFLHSKGSLTLKAVPQWATPTLLLYAGSDHLVNRAGSDAIAAAKHPLIEAHCFQDLYHEIFNEPEQNEVFARVGDWLGGSFATRS